MGYAPGMIEITSNEILITIDYFMEIKDSSECIHRIRIRYQAFEQSEKVLKFYLKGKNFV